MLPSRRLGPAVLLAAILLAPLVRADEPRWIELSWHAPPECPAGGEIEREISRLVGASRREGGTLRAVVEVTVSNDQTWRARVRTEYAGAIGDRTLEGATCRAVARAASLVISLTIDSNAGKAEEPPPPPPLPREPEIAPRLPIRLPTTEAPPAHAFVALGPRSEIGLFPSPAFGFELALGARAPMGSFQIAGTGYLPENVTVPGTAAGGKFTLLSAAARLCPALLHGTVELFGCGAVSFDRLSAQGFGVTDPGSAATNLVTVALGPSFDFLLTRSYRLTFALDASYTPGPASFVLNNVGHVHSVARFGGSARLQFAFEL
jgi:hypothetical protein